MSTISPLGLSASAVSIPVSIGELIDKLTILEIKLERITDDIKRVNIQKEHNLLDITYSSFLEKAILSDSEKNKLTLLSVNLKIINDKIWDIENQKRYHERVKDFGAEFVELARGVYINNDERARIKREINDLYKSDIIEEKSHTIKKAFVLTHLGMGDMIHCNGLVRSIAEKYDSVVVVCKSQNKQNVIEMYKDCNKIKIFEVYDDSQISCNFGFNPENFKSITSDYDSVYMTGYHLHKYFADCIHDFPYSFYDDCNIPRENLWSKFYIKYTDMKLYNRLNGKPYVFIHNTYSNGTNFDTSKGEQLLDIDKNEFLVINPCINHYKESEPYFEVAQSFVNLPIFEYVHVIINASKILLFDSSFLCLSLHLPIKTEHCFFKIRYFDYSWFGTNSKFKAIS